MEINKVKTVFSLVLAAVFVVAGAVIFVTADGYTPEPFQQTPSNTTAAAVQPTEPTPPTVPTEVTIPTAPTVPTEVTIPTVPTAPTEPTENPPTPPTEPTDEPTAPTPEPSSPYTRTVTLGQFSVSDPGFEENRRGWETIGGSVGSSSSWTVADFTGSKYLILEFDGVPLNNIDFVWRSPDAGVHWAQTPFRPDVMQDGVLVIELSKIKDYAQFVTAPNLTVFVSYYGEMGDSTWAELPLKDAYFANDR
jgi:hypothetical protein